MALSKILPLGIAGLGCFYYYQQTTPRYILYLTKDGPIMDAYIAYSDGCGPNSRRITTEGLACLCEQKGYELRHYHDVTMRPDQSMRFVLGTRSVAQFLEDCRACDIHTIVENDTKRQILRWNDADAVVRDLK